MTCNDIEQPPATGNLRRSSVACSDIEQPRATGDPRRSSVICNDIEQPPATGDPWRSSVACNDIEQPPATGNLRRSSVSNIRNALSHARLVGRWQRFKDAAVLLLVGVIIESTGICVGILAPLVAGHRPTAALSVAALTALCAGALLMHATLLPSSTSPRTVAISMLNIALFTTTPMIFWSGAGVYHNHYYTSISVQDDESGCEYRSSFGGWEVDAPRLNCAVSTFGVVQCWLALTLNCTSLMAQIIGVARMPPRAQISLGWLILSRSLLIIVACVVIEVMMRSVWGTAPLRSLELALYVSSAAICAVVGSVSAYKPTRRLAIAFLMSRGDAKVQVATGITAALSNNNSGKEQGASSLKRGAKMAFRYVTLGDGGVTFEDLFSNKADSKVYAKSHPATMGGVDAFVSHSWSDDPVAKWAALERWRSAFKQRGSGREPRLWLDKCAYPPPPRPSPCIFITFIVWPFSGLALTSKISILLFSRSLSSSRARTSC